ncbi:hypothetical protein [Haploplasma axanthum]|uniref:Uncharacterized protein n=1 Tax=Haploplasma axanthum TaxID=29552 RepID=A0A449BDC0_HAPAX|nr:hypothetical protein [Haploplasma axanthum]VEU80425.1 Uncharacterised protein [Haploplasma axanthum]
MFKVGLFILQSSMLITIYVSLIVLFLLRIILVLKNKINTREALIIVFTPLSIGVYLFLPKNKKYRKLYDIILIIFAALAIIGLIFTIYQRYF